MKVLLTNPIKVMEETPTLFGALQPLGLMHIASYLEKEGHEVKIIDTVIDKSVGRWISNLKKFNPDVVGIANVGATIYSAWDTAELVKKHSDAKVVFGGDHVTFLPGETLYCCPFVDYIVRGEGEITTAELLKYLEGKKGIKDVKGISYKKDRKIVHNPPRPWIRNLDDLPYPAWHLVDMYSYNSVLGHAATFMSSRGCPQGCSFCVTSRKCGLSYRPRSAKAVVDEMNQLMLNYPKLDHVISIDDNLMWNIKRVYEICDLLIKQKSEIKWICQGRADTIVRGGKKLLDKMYKAGCLVIQIGVETPFKHRLKAINKGIKMNQSTQAVKLTMNAGILVRATYVFGFEDETKEEMYQTLNFAKKNNSHWAQFMILTSCPGSPLFEQVKRKLATHDWRRFTGQHYLLYHDFDIEKEINRIFLKYHMRPQYIKLARELNLNQFYTIKTLFYPLIKSITGSKYDPLYKFPYNKWLIRDEEYWQKYILKTDITFEESWYHDEPKIEPIRIPYEPVEKVYPGVKEIVPVKLPATSQWVRIG